MSTVWPPTSLRSSYLYGACAQRGDLMFFNETGAGYTLIFRFLLGPGWWCLSSELMCRCGRLWICQLIGVTHLICVHDDEKCAADHRASDRLHVLTAFHYPALYVPLFMNGYQCPSLVEMIRTHLEDLEPKTTTRWRTLVNMDMSSQAHYKIN